MSDDRDPDQPEDDTPDDWDEARAVVDEAVAESKREAWSDPIVTRPVTPDSWANPNLDLRGRPSVFAAAAQGAGLFVFGIIGWVAYEEALFGMFDLRVLPFVLFFAGVLFVIHLIPSAIIAWNVDATAIVRVSGRIRTPLGIEAMLTGFVNSGLIAWVVIALGTPIREVFSFSEGGRRRGSSSGMRGLR
jgi:hypothetical protein